MGLRGLFLTVVEDAAAARDALISLSDDPRVTVVEQEGRQLSVIADTLDAESDLALDVELRLMRGIAHVDVVFTTIGGA